MKGMVGLFMLNKKEKRERVCRLDGHKPLELMTEKEKDEYFKSFSGLNYAEWCEQYKDDTLEAIHRDMDKHIKTID